jgi:hypothetical protein
LWGRSWDEDGDENGIGISQSISSCLFASFSPLLAGSSIFTSVIISKVLPTFWTISLSNELM